jgi:hypothetical protein
MIRACICDFDQNLDQGYHSYVLTQVVSSSYVVKIDMHRRYYVIYVAFKRKGKDA